MEDGNTVKIYLLIFFSFLYQLNQVIGQIRTDEEPKLYYWEQIHTKKKLKDAQDFRDVFHKDKLLMGKKRIYGNLSYNTGRVMIKDGNDFHNETRMALAIWTRIRFFEEFSLNTTFYKDFNHAAATQSTRWIQDYSYSIGRYNWRPNKLNFGYENYINNKYTDDFKTFKEKFLEGYYYVSYNQSVSEKIIDKIKLDNTTSVRLTYFTRYSIHYRDEFEVVHGSFFNGKPTYGAAMRATIYKNIYIEGALYGYFNSHVEKQPWDPDYTYGFGYFDWRSFRCSITYGNWAINRFRWHKTEYPKYGFVDGNFRFIINYIW